jgi:inosose dehydratase
MTAIADRFLFASAPDSWGVLDYPGPSWNQSYEKMLDEMVEAGYTGTELGPYGFFPTDPAVLRPQLEKRKLKLLGSFVPVVLSDPRSAAIAVEQIRKVGNLLSTLHAPFLVLADAQSPERDRISGRVPADGSQSLNPEQWRNVAQVVDEAARVASEFGLDLVFHPHVATYVETPQEIERFFDVTSKSGIGLCLDTGHSLFGGADPVAEAEKYRGVLRFVHLKDCDEKLLVAARRKGLTFDQAIEEKVFTIIGQGSIDFLSFFRVLDKNNYSGWMVVEQDIKFGAKAIPPAQSIAASLLYLRGVVHDLSAEGARAGQLT